MARIISQPFFRMQMEVEESRHIIDIMLKKYECRVRGPACQSGNAPLLGLRRHPRLGIENFFVTGQRQDEVWIFA